MTLIRTIRDGEEDSLRAVFFSSVHALAKGDYSPEQLAAWAPRQYDEAGWRELIRRLQPFVAECDGVLAGYADLQPSGYIDHFFVSGRHGGRGVGAALMAHVLAAARQRGMHELSADVSLAAEAFFARHGFVVETRKSVDLRGATLQHARMRLRLQATATQSSWGQV